MKLKIVVEEGSHIRFSFGGGFKKFSLGLPFFLGLAITSIFYLPSTQEQFVGIFCLSLAYFYFFRTAHNLIIANPQHIQHVKLSAMKLFVRHIKQERGDLEMHREFVKTFVVMIIHIMYLVLVLGLLNGLLNFLLSFSPSIPTTSASCLQFVIDAIYRGLAFNPPMDSSSINYVDKGLYIFQILSSFYLYFCLFNFSLNTFSMLFDYFKKYYYALHANKKYPIEFSIFHVIPTGLQIAALSIRYSGENGSVIKVPIAEEAIQGHKTYLTV